MSTDDSLPNFRSLIQELDQPFTKGGSYMLTEAEVELVYLSLHRLAAIEEMAVKKDWEGLALYCPTEDEGLEPDLGSTHTSDGEETGSPP